MKFVRKCKGLPWPLQFMGDLLSLHPWNEVLDRIQTIEAAGMNFVDLAMRYRDLSSHEMRAAFLYFLTFPEDAEIHAKSFALLLKSEGITRRSEQGEDILQLLAERSMIEVTKWHSDDSIECCQLHDPLLRFLAIQEAKEKRFVWKNDSSILDLFDARTELPSDMVKKTHKFGGKYMEVEQLSDVSIIFNFGGNFQLDTALMSDRVLEIDDTINKADVAREVKKRGELKHIALNNLRLLPEIMKIEGWDKHLTTVVVRDTTIDTLPSNELLKMRSLEHLSLRNTKIREIPELPESLKTLDIEGTPIETLPVSSPRPYLTTLLLRNTKVREIPKSFEKLEYLDVRDTFVQSLPDSLWNNGQLKSVLASDTLQHLNGPPSRADLHSLRILETVHVSNKWGKKLPKFDNFLEKLGLSYFKNAFSSYNTVNWGIIIELLSTLEGLSSLKIQGSDVPPIIIEVMTCPSYERYLKNLWVGGSYSLFSLNITMPPELTSLTLESLEFDKDPMPELGELRRLKTLRLRWLLYSAQIKKMVCSNGSFPQLERLQLYHIAGLEEWSVEERALPSVTHVVIDCCKALKDLSGPLVDRTTPLKELNLHAMPPGLTKKFSHLPFVKITKN
ncbi:Disease resistance protein (CC-NBS-LRR class) family protein [Rhynchospora pubera]|uniref:Disease resistance protein (CC-NBS-LRR class) family protein n=1 Tax=Rhynchospora pubera TaxID=906938 RepID=A0AAV8GAU7_9POAL|nr:Disease resistance protein (CC-NBS-LRR class) family protein [Rhynchospora pubera]